MNAYQPRTDDMQFVLSRVLNAPAQLQALPAFSEVDPELMQQVLDEAVVVDVRVERIIDITGEECVLEGFPEWINDPLRFVDMWCASHGYRDPTVDEIGFVECRRIEFRYIDAPGTML